MSLRDKAIQFRKATQFAFSGNSASLTNNQALAMASIFEYWSPLSVSYNANDIVRVEEDGVDVLYKCKTAHVSQDNWKPCQATASIWERIDTEHTGTIDDPIPAALNMIYYKDLYYVEENVLYKCIRDSEIALQYLPSQLVGHYFEVVTL